MQQTFADVSFAQCRNPTRPERFLDDMNCVVPWANMLATIEPVYAKGDRDCRTQGGARLARQPAHPRRITLAGEQNDDTHQFVQNLRALQVTP